MAPPPPKKPRKDLAKALAAASQWHFSTKNLSEKNRAAAEKNYEYVKSRIRETGGDLSPAEKTLARGFRAERATRPPPRPVLGDTADRSSATQARNLRRGAAKTGGMGQAERARAIKAFTAPEDYPGARSRAIFKELKRQGFAEPKNEAQARAQMNQAIKSLTHSERAAVSQAVKHPLDVKRNTKLVGQEQAQKLASETRKVMKNAPPPPTPGWAGKVEHAIDWATPERAERGLRATEAAGLNLAPAALRPAMQNLKSIVADVAMGLPAVGETIYKDVTGPREERGNLMWGMAKEMGKGWAKGIEAATPIPQHPIAYAKAIASGDTGYAVRSGKKDWARAQEEWAHRPFTAALNVWPAASAAARLTTFPSIARNIARANPEFSKAMVIAAARKESYVPGYGAAQLAKGKGHGWKGGIAPRTLRGQIVDPETKEVLGQKFTANARPLSRNVLGRGMQRQYDKWSRGESAIPVPTRFSELSRAAKAMKKGRVLEWEAQRVHLNQQAHVIEKYIRRSSITSKAKNVILGRLAENRARMAETFYGPQGPSGIDAMETLTAVAEDLKQIAREGGQAIPTDDKLALDKAIGKIDARLEQLGPQVDLKTGLWAQATNVMREAGYTQPLIEDHLELAAAAARAWAKRKPGRDPNDWLESPDGRNVMGFEHGVPPPEALGQSLFQVLYPGDKDIKEVEGNPYRENRVAYDKQLAAFQAGKAAGTIPRGARFEDYFDPPHKKAYELTPESEKSAMAQWAAKQLDETTDLDGNMKEGADAEQYANVKKVLPRDPTMKEIIDGEGETQIGRTTMAQKRESLTSFYNSLDPEGQELFARWYERVWDYVAYLYGEDKMREMGDAFFASQAAQSPSGGIANLFRTAEKIHRGEKMPTGKEQWLQRNIWKLMTGEHLGENPSGLAAKLMDFMDSGLGFKMRSIMQAMSKAGPGVVDRWTWRSDGYYPVPNAEDGGDMITRRVGDMEYDTFLGTARGQAVAYEYSSRRLQALTNDLNRSGFGKRRDWTVDQVQALDWFATKKKWVEEGFTPKSAEGGSPLDMALDNTREFIFDGTPEELQAVADEVGAGVRIVSGKPVGSEPGPEGHIRFSVSKDGKTHAIVAGAGGALDRLRMQLGERGHTVAIRYPGSMGGTKSQRSHQLDFPAGDRERVSEAIHRALIKEKDAPNLYMLGDDTLRVDFGSGTRALDRATAVAAKLGIDPKEIKARFTEESGSPSDVLYDYRRMEKAITQGNRAIKERGKKGPSLIDLEETLASLKERLGFKEGDTPTDDQILERANRIVGESRGKPTVLYQRRAEGVAGAIQWMDTPAGKQTIFLAEHANASTFAHELFGHAAHEMKREMPAEFAAVEKRYKKPYEEWETAEHERFATEFERYLMSGKAPIPELQPVFSRMRTWMYTVYETIRALGKNKIPPETEALFNRYFGKEPLDFTPPARIRRTGKNAFPDPTDVAGVSDLVDETSDLLNHGPDVLRNDPKRTQKIAGSMKWIEEQVLPYLKDADPAHAAKVHDLFAQFEEVKSGSSIFSADERRLLEARGKALGLRHAELRKMSDSLKAQPDRVLMDRAGQVIDALDEGQTLEEIAESIKDLMPILKEAERRTHHGNESQKLLEVQVKNLEHALDPDRKVNKADRDEALGILREMGSQMDKIFLDVFGEGLSPDGLASLKRTLNARSNILPTRLRELGLLDEGTGEGTYMPHYSIFDQITTKMRGAVRRPAAGANRKILSMEVKSDSRTFGKGPNKLVRYGSGELMADPRSMISAYKNRLRFLETSQLRNDLFRMGVEIPIDPVTKNPRLPQGWYLINGSGNPIPQRVKAQQGMSKREFEELVASGEDVQSMLQQDSSSMVLLNEYKDAWLSKGEIEKLSNEWKGDNVRMLPPEVVETMVGKVFESTPGGGWQAGWGLLSVAGRVATIFSHPMGYIGANAAANSMLLGLTRPSRMPRAINEFLRTPWSLRSKDPHTYQDIATLTGDYMAGAGIPDFYVKGQGKMEAAERAATTGAGAWASFLGDVGDQPFRVASWTGHARKYGFNTPEQWRELLDSTDPELIHVRENVSQRAREDMLDFNKLTERERTWARYLFIWPFIRAATAQPLWLMREYPARVGVMASAALGQQAAYEEAGIGEESVRSKYDAVAPAGDRSMFDISEVPIGGGSVNLNPINPLGPLAEKISDVNTIINDPKQIGRVAAGMINPAYAALGQGSFGYGGMDWEKLIGSSVPLASYVMAVMSAKKRGAQKYTDRDSWWDYIRRRELRFVPEKVSSEKIRETGEKEKDKLDTRPTWEKAEEKDDKDVEKILAHIREKGGDVGPKSEAKIKKSVEYYHKLDQAEDALKEKLGITGELTELQKLEATMVVAREFDPSLTRLPSVEVMSHKTAKEQKKLRYLLRDAIQYWRSEFFSTGRKMKVIE